MANRIILFTGKGGVGKTTCAAATALKCADKGYRTLVMSSDPAHSLGDALNKSVGPEPTEVYPNLFAQEVDLYYSMKKYWENLRELLLIVFKWQGVSEVAAEELAAIPGMGEASALLWLDYLYHSEEYDLIIVDSAPTGETLTFLTLPQVTEWWLTKAFPFQKLALQTLGFAVRKTTGIPLDKGYLELKGLFDNLRKIHEVLSNPKVSSVRMVVNPEKMVIQEARRAYTYLQLYGYGVDAVVVNRVLPAEVGKEPGWQKYYETQQKYLQEIETGFSPLPIFQVKHLREEVLGIKCLKRVARQMYGRKDPGKIFYQESTYRITPTDGGYFLNIRLPFVDETPVQVSQFGDELVIQIKNQRQNYFLPKFLNYFHVKEFNLLNGWLVIEFEPVK